MSPSADDLTGKNTKLEKPLQPPAWLRQWQALDPDEKERTKSCVGSIVSLESLLEAGGRYQYSEDYQGWLKSLDMSKRLVAAGSGGDIALSIIETIEAGISAENDRQRYHDSMYRKWDLSRIAVQMLLIGIFVQGTILAVAFYFIGWVGTIPTEMLGVKTLSLISVVIAGIAGSLARVVHESQSLSDPRSDMHTVWQMIATSIARPILAAVLALFVFALFQCGLIGIPFENTEGPADSLKFGREDFFFVAIAFVIGMNDTVGLNLLAVVSKYLPDSTAPGKSKLSGAQEAASGP